MRHAYLIIAHGKWQQLYFLLKQLDDANNDIFIHIDAKVKNPPLTELKNMVKYSNVEIIQEYKVYWGSLELVKVEFLLLKMALSGNYDYYHLLSGMDMLIKTKEEISEFFTKNNGKEFIHFDTDLRLKENKELLRRVKCYHFFVNYRKRFNKFKLLNNVFTFFERISLSIQILFKVDRTKKYSETIKYGSQWFSITSDFAKYVVENESKTLKMFNKTKCSDELFMQTLIYNSEFKNNLYDLNFDDNVEANVRLIDISNRGKNGSPYVWKMNDYEELKSTKCLFARKFDIAVDKQIVEKIYSETNGQIKEGR